MNITQRVVWNVYAGVVAAVTTVAAAKLIAKTWELSTGEAPPTANDPDVPLRRAVSWAIASGLGMGLAQLLMNRLAAKQWDRFMAAPPRGGRHS